MVVAVHTTGDPLVVADGVRKAIWSIDPDLAIARLATMEQAAGRSVSGPRFIVLLVAGFAFLALVMALIGMYGVISHSAQQRSHEFGIRIALGARKFDVVRLVLMQGFTLTFIGLALGLVLSLAGSQLLSGLLFGVNATDPVVYFGISLLLGSVALLACYIPARRATKVDPMVALRCE
jgi:putative ABC transport system permease protein